MSRMYSVSFTAVTVSAIQDFFEILAPSTASLVLHSIVISQSSDVGDAEDEMLRVTIKRVTGAPTSGSGGTTPVPVAIKAGAPAAAGTFEANNTTVLTGGTQVTIWVENFNVRAGWQFVPTPEMRPTFGPSTRLLVKSEKAPADALTMSGTLVYEAIG